MPLPNNGTMKCAHLFTNERAPVITRLARGDQLIWLVHSVVWMALLINKETKQTTLASPTKLAVKIKVISVSVDNGKGA